MIQFYSVKRAPNKKNAYLTTYILYYTIFIVQFFSQTVGKYIPVYTCILAFSFTIVFITIQKKTLDTISNIYSVKDFLVYFQVS